MKAAVRFPLPESADFIYFNPKTEGRFYTFPGGFANVAPLVPGRIVSKLEVNYFVPYTDPLTIHFEAPLFISRAEFIVAHDSGVTVVGDRLAGPEPLPANNGQLFDGYRLEKLQAGEVFNLTFTGGLQAAQEAEQPASVRPSPLVLALGSTGAGLLAAGIFLWARSKKAGEEEPEDDTGRENLDVEFRDLEE